MKKLLPQLLVLFLLVLSCKPQENASSKSTDSNPEAVEDTVDSLAIAKADSINSLIRNDIKIIITRVDSGQYKFDNHKVYSRKLLTRSYIANDYKPLWISEKNRGDAITALNSAYYHGLLPNDYHLKYISKLDSNYSELSPRDHAKFDMLLTDGVILYGYHLIKGKIKPHDLSFSWNLPVKTKNLLLTSLKNENLLEVVVSLEPQDKEYIELKKQLVINDEIIKQGGWQKLNISEVIHPGDDNKSIPSLRDRLIKESYLSAQDTSSSITYDSVLVNAVSKFQKLHGLNGDGVIGKSTVAAFNVPVEENQKKVFVNLERRRWIKYPEDNPYIKINIASYMLQFIEDGKVTYQSHVVVGKKQKKTPFFMDSLRYVVLNPTWTLPYSITSSETLRKLKRDPNYLKKHNMVLLTRGGKIVNSNGIDWNSISSGHFPYVVRQQPGPYNALGRVKFLFPNKYAIYLHDTPSKSLFSREKRAFSHGCVRLENPLDFANFLLQKEDKDKWNRDVINSIVKTSVTKTIAVKNKYPVLLMYQTAGLNDLGEVYYYEDVYDRDDKVYSLLKKEN